MSNHEPRRQTRPEHKPANESRWTRRGVGAVAAASLLAGGAVGAVAPKAYNWVAEQSAKTEVGSTTTFFMPGEGGEAVVCDAVEEIADRTGSFQVTQVNCVSAGQKLQAEFMDVLGRPPKAGDSAKVFVYEQLGRFSTEGILVQDAGPTQDTLDDDTN